MANEVPRSNGATSQIRSGPKIVEDFIASLKNDSRLDRSTIGAIESLVKEGRLTPTNLLRLLEDARGKTSV